MKYAAIVLSAGTGSRMNSDVPKQYLDLAGYPVIYYSLKTFEESEVEEVILVAGKEDLDFCRKEIVEKYGFTKVRAIIPGGKERYDSVYQGLMEIRQADYVVIHDGARPMVTKEMITHSLAMAEERNACVVAVPAKDTIRIADVKGFATGTPDRSQLWQVQTPQAFSYNLICSAYEKLYMNVEEEREIPQITDDAMVAEYAGKCKVYLAMGDYSNIKITTPEDLVIAEALLNYKKQKGKE